jgi:outer membrane protein, multidrug efflux system
MSLEWSSGLEKNPKWRIKSGVCRRRCMAPARRRLWVAALLLLMVLPLPACMKVGPDYTGADLDAEMPSDFEHQPGYSIAASFTDPWWFEFNDPELDRVVAAVIKDNPDIRTAAYRVAEVAALLRQTGADQYPSVHLRAQSIRQKQAMANPVTGEMVSVISTTHSLALPASYELDLWGRLARAAEAAEADLLASTENQRAVTHSLVAETVDLYLQISMLRRKIQVNRDMVDAYVQGLDLTESRYRRGLTTILDVRQARRALAAAQAQLPNLRAALGTSRQMLAVLQGRYSHTGTDDVKTPDAFASPRPIPAGLPSQLLERRPDIRAAEAALQAASARIGMARAARFPGITLTGGFGYASDDIGGLFRPENELWQIAAGGLQPVFNAGKLAAAQEAAEARYEQARMAYAKAVLNAFAEVESALLNQKELDHRRQRMRVFLEEAVAVLEVAEDRYRRGLVDYLTVLDAQLARFTAEMQMVDAEYAVLSNRVRLYRALGGGWDAAAGQRPVSKSSSLSF